MSNHTRVLLERIVAQFPEKMARLGSSVSDPLAQLKVSPPIAVRRLPTFDPDVTRPLSPMLRARFAFASQIVRFLEEWPAADAMSATMRKRTIKMTHRSLREHWDGSAPMLHPDENLGLFSFTHGVPENIVYVVWTAGADEPQLWKYSGMESLEFSNLDEMLLWYLA